MQIQNIDNKKNFQSDHNSIVNEIEKSLKIYNWHIILSELPPGSMLVGGYIRDLILGRLSSKPDIDIIIPKDSLLIGKKIAQKFNAKFLILDKERNIVRIIFKKFAIDIANQIGDSIVEDLKTRDFTINAISLSLDTWQIIDPLKGINDLNNCKLKSFKNKNLLDDPLRMLRCFRFLSELNFTIDYQLIQFIKLNKFQLCKVSYERIQHELKKIVKGKEAHKVILLINKMKIFDWAQTYQDDFSNSLKNLNFRNLDKNEIEQYLSYFYLTEILDDSLIKKFKFSKSDTSNIQTLRKWKRKLNQKTIDNFTELERFKLHKELESILPAFIVYLPVNVHNEWLRRWRNQEDKLFHPKNLVDGNILKKFIKIDDGPLLGNLLNYLSREFAYGRVNDFDEAINKGQQWFQQNAPKCD